VPAYDEALDAAGAPRPHYAELLAALGSMDVGAVANGLAAEFEREGVTFRVDGADDPFRLDPVPRVLTRDEWDQLRAGLEQRVLALDRFVADVYGRREIVSGGVVPARAVDTCDHLEPRVAELPPPAVRIGVAGLDVVRDPAGRFRVLEDNVRTPSGFAYVLAGRAALDRHLPAALTDGRAPYDGVVALLARTLRAAAPAGVDDPSIALLSDGPESSAWYEHRRVADALGIPLVRVEDLFVRGGRLVAAGGRHVDVVYRRTDEDRLTDEHGELTAVGAALVEPLAAGRLACVNAFGTGVADDKLMHAYVEDMVRFYLGEEPLLASVRTYDPGVERERAEILDRIDELVVKPRGGYGGHGVVVAPHADTRDVRSVAEALAARPHDFVAQETVMLSTHPTAVEGRLEPRHVDLRPYVFVARGRAEAPPGGVTRVALDRGALVVNSTQGGGAKDTWVMA
jgi:uncharacterized circularly permuted ATP-grasp superfamily protein